MKQKQIDTSDLGIRETLYCNHRAHVKVDNIKSQNIKIRRKESQGPILFTLYSEAIMQEDLDNERGRTKENGITRNCVISREWLKTEEGLSKS